ncbi:hypothetical protein [Campylobacter mucosalis]|uniref:hypothetical protein n=1 Tax=Campylobacter mucosalis TaxID=202 RepID=UPI0014704DB5|nr:hypothetical protein [Campylobacter mucosalis]
MKTAKNLIEHIYDNPSYKNLRSIRECSRLIALLEPSHQKMIDFCYVKNNVLYFMLNHPLGLQELKRDSSIITIKGLLKILITKSQKDGKDSVFSSVCDIKFFKSKTLKLHKKSNEQVQISRKQKSKAEFINHTKSETLHQKFEELREILKGKIC